MHSPSQVLEAGGVIAPDAERPPSDVPLDVIEARAFAHPALGDPVVRLSLESLASAVDAEMQVLGFGAGESVGQVGLTRRRGLGFPGAAILADPENARYALEVVAELARAGRRAASKPGHAKTAIDEIGERLGRSVPHFLPSFYEEASRLFLAAGNHSYAGQLFEKAREAERVHGLAVDEALRENTFVEFALAGALSVKSLTSYARELAGSSDPAEAYAVFRRVCVRRTLGGLPPWARMGAELKRLIKGAGLDVAAEETSLLAEIIDAPALEKAQWGFWKSCGKTLKKMCAAAPETRRHLLDLMPAVEVDQWLGLLEECGALETLVSVDADRASRPSAGPCAWFSRVVKQCDGWRRKLPASFLELLERAAPVLAAEGKPLSLANRWGDLDLDLIELALALGLAVADPDEHADLERLDTWAERADSAEVFGRDPVHVGADPRFTKLFADAIASEIGDEPFTSLAMSMDGFKAVIRDWLDARIDELDGSVGLPGFRESLETLGKGGLVPVWRAFPEQRARLETASAAAPLALTLRTGIYDEHAWPAFDQALARLAPGAEVKIGGAFPHLVVSDGVKAIVVGPAAIVDEIDLMLPQGADLEGFRYVQGQLLVIFEPSDTWRSHGYWSGDRSEVFEIDGSFYAYGLPDDRGIVLDDGSVVFGDHTMTAGDRRVGSDGALCDGESFWVTRGYDEIFELDPRTSKHGRASAPTFISEFAREGTTISYGGSALYPLPPEITDSPLGQRGALTGLRVRHRDDESATAGSGPMTEVERIDGERWSCATEHQTPDALMSFPGDDKPRPIESGYSAGIMAPTERGYVYGSVDHPQYLRGTKMLPPLSCWHCLVPRDPAGSAALRAITVEQAAALVAAGARDLEASGGKSGDDGLLALELEGSALAAAIAELLPAISNADLVTGVAHLCLLAASDQAWLERIASLESGPATVADGPKDPSGLADAVRGIAWLDEDQGNIAELEWVSELFAGGIEDGEVRAFPDSPRADCDWLPLLESAGLLAYRAALDITPEDQRRALAALLEAMCGSWLYQHLDRLRLVELEGAIDRVGAGIEAAFFAEGGHLYYAWRVWDDNFKYIEYAPDRAFAQPAGKVESDDGDTRFSGGWRDPETLGAFLAALGEGGPLDLGGLAERLAEPVGLSRSEGLCVLSGFSRALDTLARRYDLTKTRLAQALEGVQIGGADEAAIFAAAIASGPERPWSDPEGFVDGLAAAWVERVGRFTPLDEVLVETAAKELRTIDAMPTVLRMIGNSDRGPLATNPTFTFDSEDGRLVDAGGDSFNVQILEEVIPVIGHLFFHVEVGHPIRSQIPAAIAAIEQRLAFDQLYLDMPDIDFDNDAKRAAFLADFGGDPIAGLGRGRERDGIRLIPDAYEALEIWVKPAALRESGAEVARLVQLMDWTPGWLRTVELVIDGTLARLAARVADTPVPDGGYECNPMQSVPELVEEVGGDLDLDQNSAALYLQLAALPAPRDKSIRLWNGWSPKVHKEAAARLVERGLIVEAKRARAGRKHFVPGGWEALKSPLLPVETWKLDLYGIDKGGVAPWRLPFDQILPTAPIHEVFAEAYQRIKSGRGPAYEAPR